MVEKKNAIKASKLPAMCALLVALILMFGSPLGAKVWDPSFELKKVAFIAVTLQDAAVGACWTNLKEVREYAEEKLRMKGAKIDNDAVIGEDWNTYSFTINVNSARLYSDGSGPCYGNVTVGLYTFSMVNGNLHIGSVGSVDFLQANRKNLNQTVIEAVRNFIDEFR